MRKNFGKIENQEVYLYTLENEKIKVVVSDFGARLVSCIIKESNQDILLGFNEAQGYVDDVRYMGATVGRVANRIGKGIFELNEKVYQLPINNNGNTLHGGIVGFDLKVFDAEEKENAISFTMKSPDNEEGFPGTLGLRITYQLLDDGFSFISEAVSDQDTLCSITNHAYFNMDGQDHPTALENRLQIFANQFSTVDANGLATETIKNVEGTPFDFRESTRVIEQLNKEDVDEDLKLGTGFDHNYLIRGTGLKDMVKVSGMAGTMLIKTTMPCFQFYSANFLEGNSKGKAGATYPRRSGLCFEPQYYPNAIQYNCAEKPILRANEVMKHTTEYHFSGKGDQL